MSEPQIFVHGEWQQGLLWKCWISKVNYRLCEKVQYGLGDKYVHRPGKKFYSRLSEEVVYWLWKKFDYWLGEKMYCRLDRQGDIIIILFIATKV